MYSYHFLIAVLCVSKISSQQQNLKPHIIFILADDLGWNDVGFHGSSQIPTPNIDSLAYSGLILNNYYVTPICTPSRSSLMTGKYPIHTGMQHGVLYGAEPRGLPLTEKILPEYLKELGYVNRIVGKWHLGSYKKEFTPLYRGFDSHLGFWTGHQDYFDHTAMENPGWGLDMRENLSVAYQYHGKYSTELFTEEAVRLIEQHNETKPLFLYLAHAAVHSGNPYNPLPVSDEIVESFSYINHYKRRRFAGMLSRLDNSVGAVVQALKHRNMLDKSIIIFSTDNGGPAEGFNLNHASNFPLRGVKNTLWEGGVRGAGLLWSPLIKKPSRVAHQLIHISDWLPTLLHAANGDLSVLDKIDGVNMWPSLSEDTVSDRREILHNIDDIYGNAALMIGPYKLIKGTSYNGSWDNWYGPSGRDYKYNLTQLFNSQAGRALQLEKKVPQNKILELRKSAEVVCKLNINERIPCEPLKEKCLFNIMEDPCEQRNIAKEYPEILKRMENMLDKYNSSAIPPGNLPLDLRGNPKYWNYVWTNFGDYEVTTAI